MPAASCRAFWVSVILHGALLLVAVLMKEVRVPPMKSMEPFEMIMVSITAPETGGAAKKKGAAAMSGKILRKVEKESTRKKQAKAGKDKSESEFVRAEEVVHETGVAVVRQSLSPTAKEGKKSIPAEKIELTASPALIAAKPFYSKNPKPEYPGLARRRGWQGTVVLAVLVRSDGRPESLTVHRSSGYGLLDGSALRAVRKWIFQPGTKNGRPEAMQVLVPVVFTLNEDPERPTAGQIKLSGVGF